MSKRFYILYLIVALALVSCKSTTFKSEKTFYNYLNNPENGLIKTRDYDDIGFQVKYMPPEYFVYNEIRYEDLNLSEDQLDSISNLYSKNRSFLLTIKANNAKTSDIMFEGVESEEGYRERFELLNFRLGEYFYLKTDNNKYKPSLVNLENVYGLSKNRNINIVFAPLEENDDLFTSDTYDLVFEDFIFNTGISHFKFKSNKLNKKLNLRFHK